MYVRLLEVTIGDFEIAERVAEAIELLAIVVIVLGVVFAVAGTVVANISAREQRPYHSFAKRLSNGLLIGLDLLIAADIINSVIVVPSLESITALGLLVLIRTFLSWSLIVELENRWPWQPPLPEPPGEQETRA
jgi:uncharacterized membrane protein